MRYVDPDGNFVNAVAAGVGAVIGAGVGAAGAWASGASAREIAAAAVGGAVTGGLAGLTCGASLGMSVAGSAMAGAAGYCATNLVAGEAGTVEGMANAAASGAVGAMAGAVVGKAVAGITAASKSLNVGQTTKDIVPYKRWPDQDGFLGGYSKTETAKPRQILSRIGDINGTYVAPPGTSLSERGLPSSYLNKTETLWKVEKSFDYKAGVAAPWQGSSGGGIQLKLSDTVKNLYLNGYISPLE